MIRSRTVASRFRNKDPSNKAGLVRLLSLFELVKRSRFLILEVYPSVCLLVYGSVDIDLLLGGDADPFPPSLVEGMKSSQARDGPVEFLVGWSEVEVKSRWEDSSVETQVGGNCKPRQREWGVSE